MVFCMLSWFLSQEVCCVDKYSILMNYSVLLYGYLIFNRVLPETKKYLFVQFS